MTFSRYSRILLDKFGIKIGNLIMLPFANGNRNCGFLVGLTEELYIGGSRVVSPVLPN